MEYSDSFAGVDGLLTGIVIVGIFAWGMLSAWWRNKQKGR